MNRNTRTWELTRKSHWKNFMRTTVTRFGPLLHPLPLAAAFCLLAACAGNGEGLDENGRPIDESDSGGSPPTADFQSIQDQIFTPICTGCHAGASAPLGLRLDAGSSYAMLVGVASAEVPSLLRVTPGDPDASYLVHKVEGRAAVGQRMPLGGPPLSAQQIATIRQWITDGAAMTQATGKSLDKTVDTALDSADSALDVPAFVRTSSPLPNTRLASAQSTLVVALSRELDASSVHAGSVELSRGDGVMPVSEALAQLSRFNPTAILLSPPAAGWAADRYRLVVRGNGATPVTDLAGTPIDGDGDGAPGGDFELFFELETVR